MLSLLQIRGTGMLYKSGLGCISERATPPVDTCQRSRTRGTQHLNQCPYTNYLSVTPVRGRQKFNASCRCGFMGNPQLPFRATLTGTLNVAIWQSEGGVMACLFAKHTFQHYRAVCTVRRRSILCRSASVQRPQALDHILSRILGVPRWTKSQKH